MTVAAILSHKGREVASAAPTDTVATVAALLAERRIGAVPVLDRAGQLLGILSERDLVRSLVRNGAHTLEMTAAQLMTQNVFTVSPATTVGQAMTMMTENRIRHLPVLEEGRMVGMVSIGDVVAMRLGQQEQEVDSLRAYVSGS